MAGFDGSKTSDCYMVHVQMPVQTDWQIMSQCKNYKEGIAKKASYSNNKTVNVSNSNAPICSRIFSSTYSQDVFYDVVDF